MDLKNLGWYNGSAQMWPPNDPNMSGSFNGLAANEECDAGCIVKESSTNGYLAAASNSCDVIGVCAESNVGNTSATNGARRPRVYKGGQDNLFVWGVGNGTLAVTDVHKKCDVYATTSGVTTIDLADTTKGNIYIVGVDLVRNRVLGYIIPTFTNRP